MWRLIADQSRGLALDLAEAAFLAQIDAANDEDLAKWIEEGATPVARLGLDRVHRMVQVFLIPFGPLLGAYLEEGRGITFEEMLDFIKKKRPAKYKVIMATPRGRAWAMKVFNELRQVVYQDGAMGEEGKSTEEPAWRYAAKKGQAT